MSEILDEIPGIVCHVDVLVAGKNQEEHDNHLHAVLQRIQAVGLTLNRDKSQFSCSRIVFLGHVIDANGLPPDPYKTEAIQKMKSPTTVTELRRFKGMINQLNKFSPKIAETSQPLRELLKYNTAWLWTPNHEDAIQKLKEEKVSPRVLANYDLNAELKSVPMHQHTVWEQSSFNVKVTVSENQWHLPPVASVILKVATHKLKKRPWL